MGTDKKKLEDVYSKWGQKQRSDNHWGKIIREMEKQGNDRMGTKRYCLYGGLLFMEKRQSRNKCVLCIPEDDVEFILHKFHDDNLHPGSNRLQRMLSNMISWRGMTREIKQYVRSCHKCQLNKSKPCAFSGPWQSIIPRGVGDLIAVDILGPLVASVYGYTCVLIIVDVFSKYSKLYGLRRATSTTCMNKVRAYVNECGLPKRLLSDNGPQFRSVKWTRGLRDLGIKEVHTAMKNPQGNPSERYLKVVGECLRIACGEQHSSWAKYLMPVEKFINLNYSEITEMVPMELQKEERYKLGIEKYIKYPPGREETNWEVVIKQVRERLIRKVEKRNKRQKVKWKEFEIGQDVLIRNDRISNKIKIRSSKLMSLYQGPGEVIRRIGINTYVVRMGKSRKKGKVHNIVM